MQFINHLQPIYFGFYKILKKEKIRAIFQYFEKFSDIL